MNNQTDSEISRIMCSICRESDANVNKWQCKHSFCAECSRSWEGLCPICRSEKRRKIKEGASSSTDWCCGLRGRKVRPNLHYAGQSYLTSNIYYGIWRKDSCLTDSHTIRFESDLNREIGSNGSSLVIGTCETCGEIQWFPYMG